MVAGALRPAPSAALGIRKETSRNRGPAVATARLAVLVVWLAALRSCFSEMWSSSLFRFPVKLAIAMPVGYMSAFG